MKIFKRLLYLYKIGLQNRMVSIFVTCDSPEYYYCQLLVTENRLSGITGAIILFEIMLIFVR